MPTKRNCLARCGVIAFVLQPETQRVEYLLVTKRYSIGYTQILLGRYSIHNFSMVRRLVEDMTDSERQRILWSNFRSLYVQFWGRFDPAHEESYRCAHLKFKTMRRRSIWKQMIRQVKTHYETPGFEFPKGKKTAPEELSHLVESNFDCAIREFSEETCFPPTSYHLIPYTKPFEMERVGMDNRTYLSTFYVVKFLKKESVQSRQSSEIQAMTWMTSEDMLKQIRPKEVEFRDLIQRVNTHLINLYFSQGKTPPPSPREEDRVMSLSKLERSVATVDKHFLDTRILTSSETIAKQKRADLHPVVREKSLSFRDKNQIVLGPKCG